MSFDFKAYARRDIMAETMVYEALGAIPTTKCVIEYTVDWCQGEEVQTVLRTQDRKAAVKLHDRLHVLAVRLHALGVSVCLEMSSETAFVPAPLKARKTR